MKLASLKGGRDGRLVVVSQDLAWCADAGAIALTLQAALDNWGDIEPQLRGLAESLGWNKIGPALPWSTSPTRSWPWPWSWRNMSRSIRCR